MNQATYEKKLKAEMAQAKARLQARGILNPSYVELETEAFKSDSFNKLLSTKLVAR